MNWQKLSSLVFASLLLLSPLAAVGLAQEGESAPAAVAEIEADLLDVLNTEGTANYFAFMAEKADLSPAYQIDDWDARGWYVYNALREVADHSQAPVVAYAKEHGLNYQTFFGANAVYFKGGDLETTLDLAALPAVERLALEGISYIPPDLEPPPGTDAYGWNLDTLDPASNLYGMQAIQVWTQHGIRGDGIVVANIDSGVYYQHNALVRQYRGSLGGGSFQHNYNWWDPTLTYPNAPGDGHGHGTGTIGIMAGETADLTEKIGVAPGAQWIACKGCTDSATCPESALFECGDFLVAPWDLSGQNPDPTKRPHIINNSWGASGCDLFYQPYNQAWVAAGIFPAWSTGSTVACGAIGSPGDNPEAFGTAAHNAYGNNLYAGGPSCFFTNPSCDPDAHEVDPHLNAPSLVRSSTNCQDCYSILTGTSAASPHSAGTVALLWSGNPGYIGDVPGTFTILEQSANPNVPAGNCGEPACAVNHVPNYEYGWGYLDAFGAINMAGTGDYGMLNGTITEAAPLAAPGDPLPGITVTAERMGGGNKATTTDASGYYTMTLFSGMYTVTAEGLYHTASTLHGIVVATGTVTTQDFALDPKGLLYGYVTDADSGASLEATVTADGLVAMTEPATGYYSMCLDAGTYEVMAEATDYASQTVQITLNAGQQLQQDFQLLATIAVVPEPIALTLQLGQTGSASAVMTNNMAVDYPFEFIELGAPTRAVLQAAPILLMGDDVDATGWQTYRDALSATGATWDEWNLDSLSFPNPADLAPYSVLIVFDESTLAYGDAECQILADWLTSGGKSMFATTVDWLWDLENGTPGDGEHNLYLLFQTEYLGDDAGTTILDMEGVHGDFIGGSFAPPNTLGLAGTSDSSGDYADQALSVATTGLLYGSGGTGSSYAGLTHYEDSTYQTAWLGANFHNGLVDQAERNLLMENILGFFLGEDVPWYATSIVSGTVPAGTSLAWTNHFSATPNAGIDQPGEYQARLRIRPRLTVQNRLPTRDVDVVLTVLPPGTIGKLEGTVSGLGYCDDETYPLEANVLVESSSGLTWTTTTDPASGYYDFWLNTGAYTVTASAAGHVDNMATVQITTGQTTTQDLPLRYVESCMDYTPGAFALLLPVDTQVTETLYISNGGAGALAWAIRETTGTVTIPSILPSRDTVELGSNAPWVDVPWVSEVPTDGVVTAGSAFDVGLVFNAAGLATGHCYTAQLGLIHDDPGHDDPSYIPLRLCVKEYIEVKGHYYLPIIVRNYRD